MDITNTSGAITVQAGNSPQQGISLSRDGSLVTLHSPDGVSASFRVTEVLNREITLGSLKAVVKQYSKTDSDKTSSSNPLPSISVSLTGGDASALDQATGDKPWLALAPGPAIDTVAYQLGRAGDILTQGVLKKGEPLPLGWADWRATLLATGSSHGITFVTQPGEENEQGGLPGFHAYLRDPTATSTSPDKNISKPLWVVSGDVTPLVLGESLVRVGYGLELRPIPFSIALTDFQVPRDEGTDTPSDFRATVLFKDSKTGEERTGMIHMNHPASFPGGFLANMTGLNYKFSQAEWNPRDLKETTLQVLYDPGWLFKWIGSLAICLGIATMFYIRPSRPSL